MNKSERVLPIRLRTMMVQLELRCGEIQSVHGLKSWLHDRWLWMDQELAEFPDYTKTELTEIRDVLTVYPNPVQTNLLVKSQKGMMKIELSDLLGNARISVNLQQEHLFLLKMEGLAPGFYLLKVAMKKGEVKVHKIIVR